MTERDNSGPAFPESYVGADRPHAGIGDGMTLRDYFAAQALPACIEVCRTDTRADEYESHVATKAYMMADAMLKARSA